MKTITYEELKPHLTEDRLLWTEDDATMHCEGHEGTNQAFKRIFGSHALKPVARGNFGDCGCEIYLNCAVFMWACDGGSIYQLSESAMRELGLVEFLYPEHTPH